MKKGKVPKIEQLTGIVSKIDNRTGTVGTIVEDLSMVNFSVAVFFSDRPARWPKRETKLKF